MEPAAERQLIQGAVEAGLVVDLVGREMRQPVLDPPAATVAARRPTPRIEGAKVGADPRDLAVVDGKGISAFWVEGSCAWRWRPSPSAFSAREGLRSRPVPPARHSSRLTSSLSPFRPPRRIATRLSVRGGGGGFLYAAALPCSGASRLPFSQASLPLPNSRVTCLATALASVRQSHSGWGWGWGSGSGLSRWGRSKGAATASRSGSAMGWGWVWAPACTRCPAGRALFRLCWSRPGVPLMAGLEGERPGP